MPMLDYSGYKLDWGNLTRSATWAIYILNERIAFCFEKTYEFLATDVWNPNNC